MAQQKNSNPKITFYVDEDVKKRLDKLDPGIKSHTINEMLRKSFKRGANLNERVDVLEAAITKLEADLQFDGFAIMALRRILLNHFGERVAFELEKEFNEILYGTRGVPPRKNWKGHLDDYKY